MSALNEFPFRSGLFFAFVIACRGFQKRLEVVKNSKKNSYFGDL